MAEELAVESFFSFFLLSGWWSLWIETDVFLGGGDFLGLISDMGG